MTAYILRRILLMIPTLLGILLVSFVVVQFAPGGPVEKVIAQITGSDVSATARISGGGSEIMRPGSGGSGADPVTSKYRGAQGLDPQFIKELEKQFGFDKPAHERFLLMLWNFIRFDFGKSYFRDAKVIDLIKEKMPVSISLGLWMMLLSYMISIPLGVGEGGARRLALRRVDVRRDRHRLRGARLPLRDPVDRAVRRRLVLVDLPAARADVG